MSKVKRMLKYAGAGLNVAAALAFIVSCESSSPNDPLVQAPPMPTGVNVAATSESAVSVSWDAVQGATGYVVYRDGIALDTTARIQFTDAELAACAAYSYQVAALNSGGLSELSAAVSVSLIPQPIPGNGGILLEEPNGCVDYKVGDTMIIDWELDSLRDGLVIRFSSNGGLTFMIIGDALASREYYQHGPYRWVIPDSVYAADGSGMPTVSDSCMIKIHEYWATSMNDESDRLFRITAQ